MSDRPRLLYLITEDWYFWSHRADLARAAQEAGYEVVVATRVTDHGERIREQGFQLMPLGMVRGSHNPFRELIAIAELVRLYRRVRPTVVHHVAMKPILYGTLAAWVTRVPGVINAFAGLGYVFVDDRSRLLRWCVKTALKAVLHLGRSTVLVQNHDDQNRLVSEGVVPVSRTRIVAGSGIDVELYSVQPEPSGIPIVLLPARMLWDKGVGEFVEAARDLKRKGVMARYVLVGRCDEHNPAAISQARLAEWVQEGVVEWWGHREDMVSVYGAATLVVLPSYYGEGLPKVLLEAAACGRAIVATDMPGCRDIVRDRDNGLLVPPRNSGALALAIEELLADGRSRQAMGRRGRELAVAEWSVPEIAGQMLNLYREQLKAVSTMDQLNGYA
ncbi:MAG: glycosyltransferase family 4 protein [Nitrospira sp.]|jgi:glycosyltransferase involved in cell wall biosynthesis|nr:glycosyltransferase family 4 protein [Nitrospira sp. BO4]